MILPYLTDAFMENAIVSLNLWPVSKIGYNILQQKNFG